MDRHRINPRYVFYRPYYDSRTGQILILSAPNEHPRDGLPVGLIGRLFPFEYEGIAFEPTRPSLMPKESIILIGRSEMFVGSEADGAQGRGAILPIGWGKLGQRLEAIEKACCYIFEGSPRIILNTVTGRAFASVERDEFGQEIDHAVIRRVFRPGYQNTISFEGNHGTGTLAAAIVGTSREYLSMILDAIGKVDDYDPAVPLEILVRGAFDREMTQNVRTYEAMKVQVLNIVYGKRWIYDFETDSPRWVDQRPYEIQIALGRKGIVQHVNAQGRAPLPVPPPALEIEADLQALEPETAALCRQLLEPVGGKPSLENTDARSRRRLNEALTLASDLFRLTLRAPNRMGQVKVRELATNPSETRLLRKRYLVHLALCLLFGETFHCVEPEIRRLFPELCHRELPKGKSLVDAFIATIHCRMRDGFLDVLGDVEKPKGYASIPHDKKEKTYRLLLQQMTVVLKFRFPEPELIGREASGQ